MATLRISGDTLVTTEWDIESILKVESKENSITRLVDSEWFDRMSYCGLTYGEINQLENFNY
jgi:hypothetical protein